MKMWVISAITSYSYENNESNVIIAATKEEALKKFKELSKRHLDSYKSMLEENYEVSTSFKEYSKICKEYNEEWLFGYEESEKECKVTIYGETKSILGDCETEETVIRAFEVSSESYTYDCVCILDNAEDLDVFYKQLS